MRKSNWIISPRFGVKIKNVWVATTQKMSTNITLIQVSSLRLPCWQWSPHIICLAQRNPARFLEGCFPTTWLLKQNCLANTWSLVQMWCFFVLENLEKLRRSVGKDSKNLWAKIYEHSKVEGMDSQPMQSWGHPDHLDYPWHSQVFPRLSEQKPPAVGIE